jgi:tRNA C32,U32 (ribose-2'-O)-methylase TrmJ
VDASPTNLCFPPRADIPPLWAGGNTLLFGSESRGAPEAVHARADLRVRIPQTAGTRSLNLAVAAGIGVAEALRQTHAWPRSPSLGAGGRAFAGKN